MVESNRLPKTGVELADVIRRFGQKLFWCYHACRNRACPKCQGKRTEQWLKQRQAELLPGMLSVLHTWNGQLGYHPHVHMLIAAGGIWPDGRHWEPARNEYLLPVAVLSTKVAAIDYLTPNQFEAQSFSHAA